MLETLVPVSPMRRSCDIVKGSEFPWIPQLITMWKYSNEHTQEEVEFGKTKVQTRSQRN
jgi:hypothetical protein